MTVMHADSLHRTITDPDNALLSADSGLPVLAGRTPGAVPLTLCSCCSAVSFGSAGLLGYRR